MDQAVLYGRVSLEEQARGDSVSIDQQLAEMQALCQRSGWKIAGEFVDKRNYKATLPPNKGKSVNPSGERADRPEFLAMLDRIRTGEVDIVLCWRDDRLVRHPRVAVALEDALDVGDVRRNGRTKTQIRDATGATIDRFTLSIKATIWREENKRRAERTRMGKQATLEQGRWPGECRRWGYKSIKPDHGRGRIVVEDPDTAPIVHKIFEMYDTGKSVRVIRQYLMDNAVPQIYDSMVQHEWSLPLITRILRSPEYLGEATWSFQDGTTIGIEIPQLVDEDLWNRVQRRMDRNKSLSTRNAKGVYMMQGLLRCGECGNGISARRHTTKYEGYYMYTCHTAVMNPHEPHPRPFSRSGPGLDWKVWRHLVDFGIKRPEVIEEQVAARQAELRAQGDNVLGDLAHAQKQLDQLAQERAFYQRQAGRGRITEAEFDARMEETSHAQEHWTAELERLRDLRDNSQKVRASLDYAGALMAQLESRLGDIDQTPSELRALSRAERRRVLKERQKIVRALCDEIRIYADGRIEIAGVFDGSEGAQFGLLGC